MEDVFKFLLVAAVIVIGLVKQFKKEANKNADKSPDIPMPDVDNPLSYQHEPAESLPEQHRTCPLPSYR